MTNKKQIAAVVLITLMASIFTLIVGSFIFVKVANFQSPPVVLAQEKILDDREINLMASFQGAFNKVADVLLPSTVRIDVVSLQKVRSRVISPWDFFFENPNSDGETMQKGGALGSGFVIDREGNVLYILTNYHVIENATTVSVEFHDGRYFDAKVLGVDKRKDIAMISVDVGSDNNDIKAVKLGDSSGVKVGDWVLAIGSPFGFDFSVTTGIISAIGRTGGPGGPGGNINDFIQTDTAINKGNSGGPLVNIQGEVIGVNDWIATESGGSIGLGFSIPINNVKVALKDLKAGREPSYGWMGVTVVDVKTLGAKEYAESAGFTQTRGAVILDVYRGSPADKSGIKPGDLVLAVNGTAVESSDRLVYMIGSIMAGETAAFSIIRDAKAVNVNVKVDARQSDENLALMKDGWPGMIVLALNETLRKELKLIDKAQGVFVARVDPKTTMSIAGFKLGDVITAINGEKVSTVQDYFRIINSNSSNGRFTFDYIRQGQQLNVTLKR